jgi:hypothetical protein
MSVLRNEIECSKVSDALSSASTRKTALHKLNDIATREIAVLKRIPSFYKAAECCVMD